MIRTNVLRKDDRVREAEAQVVAVTVNRTTESEASGCMAMRRLAVVAKLETKG